MSLIGTHGNKDLRFEIYLNPWFEIRGALLRAAVGMLAQFTITKAVHNSWWMLSMTEILHPKFFEQKKALIIDLFLDIYRPKGSILQSKVTLSIIIYGK